MKVGVKIAGSEFVVIVENENVGYKQEFGSYEPVQSGPYSISNSDIEAARSKALTDANDWAVKFLAAGIKTELIETML